MPPNAVRMAALADIMSAICDQMSAATISASIEKRRIARSPCVLGVVCCPNMAGVIAVAANPARKKDRRVLLFLEEGKL